MPVQLDIVERERPKRDRKIPSEEMQG